MEAEEEEKCCAESQAHTRQLSDSQQEKYYDIRQVKKFLQQTKTKQNVRLEDFFCR